MSITEFKVYLTVKAFIIWTIQIKESTQSRCCSTHWDHLCSRYKIRLLSPVLGPSQFAEGSGSSHYHCCHRILASDHSKGWKAGQYLHLPQTSRHQCLPTKRRSILDLNELRWSAQAKDIVMVDSTHEYYCPLVGPVHCSWSFYLWCFFVECCHQFVYLLQKYQQWLAMQASNPYVGIDTDLLYLILKV